METIANRRTGESVNSLRHVIFTFCVSQWLLTFPFPWLVILDPRIDIPLEQLRMGREGLINFQAWLITLMSFFFTNGNDWMEEGREDDGWRMWREYEKSVLLVILYAEWWKMDWIKEWHKLLSSENWNENDGFLFFLSWSLMWWWQCDERLGGGGKDNTLGLSLFENRLKCLYFKRKRWREGHMKNKRQGKKDREREKKEFSFLWRSKSIKTWSNINKRGEGVWS